MTIEEIRVDALFALLKGGKRKSEMTEIVKDTKRKRTEEEIEHEEELLEMSYISLLNMCDDGHLSRSGNSTFELSVDCCETHLLIFLLY